MLKRLFPKLFRPREITLDELDSIMLRHVDGELKNIDMAQPKTTICLKCSGKLAPVTPDILLGEMVLHECVSCHERCYLKKSGLTE